MACKSLIYAANSNSQAVVATGSVINFGSIVRKAGCGANLSGGNVLLKGAGYYNIDSGISFTNGANGGVLTITAYKGGVLIPGATASITIGANSLVNIAIPSAVVRETCNCEFPITIVVSGLAGTVTNAAIRAERVI